jgi:hypothetical protein
MKNFRVCKDLIAHTRVDHQVINRAFAAAICLLTQVPASGAKIAFRNRPTIASIITVRQRLRRSPALAAYDRRSKAALEKRCGFCRRARA